jgi:hypothetical protein
MKRLLQSPDVREEDVGSATSVLGSWKCTWHKNNVKQIFVILRTSYELNAWIFLVISSGTMIDSIVQTDKWFEEEISRTKFTKWVANFFINAEHSNNRILFRKCFQAYYLSYSISQITVTTMVFKH